MNYSSFEQMFCRATGFEPFPYQIVLAKSETQINRLSIPTGLGKTAAVVLGWLWRRRWASEEVRNTTPRRLVYCLPMRALVEQTRDTSRGWLRALGILAEDAPAVHPATKVAIHVLMGGNREIDWDHWPDRDQILIGTQDMLLSRALNRGYAMSRYRWPIHFALLNNDCLWVMDEVQLMGDGLATTAQLQAFRRILGTEKKADSLWMSATMREEWLNTVDFDTRLDAGNSLGLSAKDREQPRVAVRFEATKPIEKLDFSASKDGKQEAALIDERHEPSSRTLVVVNTVKRAQAIFNALKKRNVKADVILLHSRFRQKERHEALVRLLAQPGEHGTIAVSTQVVEAGVDVSARLLITDLAPWSSMVQRFGRCNRRGEFNASENAAVYWISPPDLEDDKKLKAAPYTADELRAADEILSKLDDVGPARLPAIEETATPTHVVRRRDILELFDTTPDLAGADIDISRFIREADEHNVQVFWRNFEGERPESDEPPPQREELCPAPLGEIRAFLKKHPAWRWDFLEKEWVPVHAPFPGLVMMLSAQHGGYDPLIGWSEKSKRPVAVAEVDPARHDHNDRDQWSENRRWTTISSHTEKMVSETRRLLAALDLGSEPWVRDLLIGARWHDAGKAHEVFQEALSDQTPPGGPWAKSPDRMRPYRRRGFRHELASALAMLQNGLPDLAAYLAAAHHGKIRLSIRSLPIEKHPDGDPGRRFARGIWEGDVLGICDLGSGNWMPKTQLDLSVMELGVGPSGSSWVARMLTLRDRPDLGPFRLAFLEALLRVSDWRASAEQTQEVGNA